jgi:hypothetical protein
MAETSSQQSLSALCNAGNSVGLRRLDDLSRRNKVSMISVRELQRKWKYLYLLGESARWQCLGGSGERGLG